MNSTALAEMFGSRAAEAVLLHLFHYGESYGRAVSSDFGISLDSVQRQLEKFERAGVLVAMRHGRTVVYSFNPRSKAAARLRDLVAVYYDSMSLEIKEERFAIRRRHRSKDKPIIYSKE
ncbi:MAG: winged helix-turn-helix domain-containing protein [Luteolibacter sp.]|uniref:winged helix-turn-helix domain-containing protein n=1 Tax=Luteolibacter sp. TaxID=1962973 RepID=UPI0032654BBB